MKAWSHAKRTSSRAVALLSGALIAWSCRGAEPPPAETKRDVAPEVAVAPTACGVKGQPECPTQRWMKATLQAYLRTRDYKRLEASFKELAAHGPADFESWEGFAKSGASAAATEDEALVRKSCQDCHDRYRAEFRQRYRSAVFM